MRSQQVEQRLQQSEHAFHALVDAVIDYAVFMLDPSGHVATWNPGAKRIKGYDASEIIGKHFSIFYTSEDRAAHRPERILDILRREGRFEDESWRLRKDGSRFWADVVITAVRDQQGATIGFAKVTRDLTDRRAAEENERKLLQERTARLTADLERRRFLGLLEEVPAIVNFLRGPDLVFEFAHPRAVVVLGGRDVLGKPLAVAVPEMTEQPYYEQLRTVYEKGEPLAQQEALAWHNVNGQRVESYWNSVYLPVRNDLGEVEGVMTFDIDVTESVRARHALEAASRENAQAREELEKLNRAKDEFLATMSHELRTPLSAILGWSNLLRKVPPDPSKLQRGLEVIERNARAQTRLVNDLLDVSRIISGKLELRTVKTELAPILHQATDVVRPGADAKGVRLVIDIDPELGAAIIDADRLHQVLWNLLINAIKFTPRGGRITVTGDRAQSGIMLTVRDTGAGIAADHLPHIFERFRQVDSSTTRKHGGLGLGLAIVRHLTELHGGAITADSDGPGHGTTFTIKLPIRPIATSRLEDEDDGAGSSEQSKRCRPVDAKDALANISVLAVDDEVDSLEMIREVLEQAGALVTTATSARAALTEVESGKFDIIVSDIGMPELDGYDLIREIRGLETAADMPAIALTAYARAEDMRRALAAGYQQYLAKPVEHRQLLEKIASLVQARRSAQA